MRISDWSSDVCSSDLVRAENPDVAIIATGGLPNTSFLPDGEDLVVTTWDILSGAAKPADDVLLFDDNGAHPGMTAAEAHALAADRTSVAQGKSGSVRVDLCGRRSIKKKKNKQG